MSRIYESLILAAKLICFIGVFCLLVITISMISESNTIKRYDNSVIDDRVKNNVSVKEIDSCEYIIIHNKIESITHKGNCKYCLERQRLSPNPIGAPK